MVKKLLLLSVASITMLCFACKNSTRNASKEKIATEPNHGIGDGATSPAMQFPKSIENAHSKADFLNHKAVQFTIELTFNGSERLHAKITSLTNSGKIKIEKNDGTTLVFDGAKASLFPADKNYEAARFDMFTWHYFFMLPFKLTDEGTRWAMPERRKIDNKDYATARLTFEGKIGDSPKDWYILYKEPDNKLKAAAYIVTLNQDITKAEANPHAIVYHDYEHVENIPFAKRWSFHNWTKRDGATSKIGEAKISNITFIETSKNFFSIPKNQEASKI